MCTCELRRQLGVIVGVRIEALQPVLFETSALVDGFPEVIQCLIWHIERLCRRPSEVLLCRRDLVGSERTAVSPKRPSLVRTAITQRGVNDDDARPLGLINTALDRAFESVEIISIVDVLNVPLERFESF